MDFGIFSPLGFKDRKTLTSDLVQLGELTLREMSVARSRKFRQRIFGDRDWKKQFLVTAQGPEDWRSYVNEPGDSSARTFTVNMLTGFRSDHIQGNEVRRQIGLLERTLGPHPVLEEVGSIAPGAETRFFSNLRLSFGAAHLKMFEGTGDWELWLELADLLLGSEYRQVWSSEEDRREWSRRYSRKAFREDLPGGLASLSQPREKVLNLKERFRLAKRAVRKFDRLQTLIAEPDCLRCMSKTFTKQKDIVTLQMLLFRLASRDQQNPPGYRYEVFIDPLLRPRSIGNGLSFQHGQLLSDSVIAEPEDLESAERGVAVAQQSAGQSYSGWSGDETFIDSSNPRLQAGEIYLNVGHPGDSDAPAPCWKLRLFSDLQFAADLSLRLDLRISSTFKADQPLGVYLIPLERSTEVVQSPFTLSRFSYDVALPVGPDLQPKTSYTFLMRVINAEGLPVSEEEKVHFEWPAVGFSEAAPNCRGEIPDG